jgi:hypothetical protein
LLLSDDRIMSHLIPGDIESMFKVENFLHHVDYIFDRVFGGANDKA